MSDPLAPPEERQSRRLEHLSRVRQSVTRRRRDRALNESIYSAAESSGDPYLGKLANVSRSANKIGLDGMEFFKAPGAYQAVLERDEAPPGFLDRMWARTRDGDLLNRRGAVGFRALIGRTDIDAALREGGDLRNQMSDAQWADELRGIEKQLGFALEMVGQQARNLPTAAIAGLATLGGGMALGAVGGPGGALAGGLGAFGSGVMIGMAAENAEMMSGLAFLDLMELPLVLPDGTETKMPVEVARGVGLVVGSVQAGLEVAQVGSWVGAVPGARQLASKAMTRLLASDKLREIAVRYATRHISATAENIVEEMMQEVAGMAGTEVALAFAKGKTGAERAEAIEFGAELRRRLLEVATLAPAFGMMTAPQAALGSVADTARVAPERVFDPSAGGEIVPIANLALPETVTERQRATTTALIQQARRGAIRLPAIGVAQTEDGKMYVSSPDDQALVSALRNEGFRAVRVRDFVAEIEAQEQPAEQPAGEPQQPATPTDEQQPKPGPVPIRSLSAFEALNQQLHDAAEGTEITPEQATMAAILLERRAQAAGQDLLAYVRETFQGGQIIASEETSSQMLEGLVPGQEPRPPREPIEPSPEQRTEQRTEPEREPEQTQEEPETDTTAVIEDAGGEPAIEPIEDAVEHEPSVSEIARQPGQAIDAWWRDHLTTEGRRQALRKAGFDAAAVESIAQTRFAHLDDSIIDVLEREFPDPTAEGIPVWARRNFERQQALLPRLTGNIGKAKQEGTLTERQQQALDEIDELRKVLPDSSDLWRRIMQEAREKYDTDLATERAATRAETEARMAAEGWKVGDVVWLPEVNMLTGQVIYRNKGTVKINKSGIAYVAGAGKQFDLFENKWTKVGDELPGTPRRQPEPEVVQVEPAGFGPIPALSGDSRDSTAIVVWEPNDGSRIEVVAGYWRADLAKRYQERTEEAFTVPAIRYREADGVTLEEARASALRGVGDQNEKTLLPTVRFLRGIPIDDKLQTISNAIPPSLPMADLRTVIGLSAVDDEVFALVEARKLSAEYASYLGDVPDRETQVARATEMVADPPTSSYEAELRAGPFGALADETGIVASGEATAARILVAAHRLMYGAPRPRNAGAVERAAQALVEDGGPLADLYRQTINQRGMSRGGVVRLALPTLWATHGPFDGLVDQVDQGGLSLDQAGGQLLDALARATRPKPPDPITPERAQDVADETAPRVTFKKARIEITHEGVRAVPIDEDADPAAAETPTEEPTITAGEAKEAARARLAQRLSLQRITDSLRGERPPAAPPAEPPAEPPPAPRPRSAYVETKKGITGQVVPRHGVQPFEVADWDGEGGWAMSSGMFRTETIPTAVRKTLRYASEPRPWSEVREQLGVDPDLAYEVQPVASEDVTMRQNVVRPVAMVQEVGGERDGFFDDRLVRYIRTTFKGKARLHIQHLRNMKVLLGIMDGNVVAVVPQLGDTNMVWADDLRQKARQETPEPTPEPQPKPPPRTPAARQPGDEKLTISYGSTVVHETNPTPEEAPGTPPVPPRPVKIEDASETELLDGIEAMFDDEDTPTDLLYSDGAAGVGKMARVIYRLVELLMIDQELTDFPAFASAMMQKWGNRRHRERVFAAMRDWYEAGREAEVAPDMTAPAEIDRWYEENADVARPGGGDDRRPGTEPPPEGRPGAGGRRAGTGAVGPGDRAAGGRAAPGDERRRQPGDRGRGAGDRDRPAPGGDRERGPTPADVASTENWSFERGALDATEGRGPTAKARGNIEAIEVLKQLEREGRQATPDEQAVLAKYVGWGGLQGAFPHPSTGKVEWEDVAARLRELLTDTEYEQARSSILYAHYTSETVIASMWDTLRRLGFEGGRVMEPGAGVGHFAGMMPPELARKSGYFGIELDPVTAAIAKQLYPNWPMRQQDFARTAVPPNTFDLAIGNPPFANFSPADPKYDQHKFLLHDYFFAKALDGVKPGGILAFVTSAGTMNKQNAKARRYLADRADFLGAVRLPNTAFLRNAGTEVTADIIFLRKRAANAPENHVAEWVESREVEMPTRDGSRQNGWVNPYFLDTPDQVLGEPGLFDELVAGVRYAVRERPGSNLEQDLAAAVDRLVKDAPAFDPAAASATAAIEILEETMKEGSYYINDAGVLMQYRAGAGRDPRRPGSSGKLVKMSQKDQKMVRALLPVRDAYREVLAADLADDADAAAAARAKLNQSYDSFVAKYGPIRKTKTNWQKVRGAEMESRRQRERERVRATGEDWNEGDFDDSAMIAAGVSKTAIAKARQEARDAAAAAGRPFSEGTFDPAAVGLKPIEKLPNLAPFLGDPEAYRVMALEKSYDEDTGEAVKSEVFERNIIRREIAPKIETGLDAMLHVLATTGDFDIGAIASAWNRSVDELVRELGDLTYMDPITNDWMLAEEYLSGNVVRRLEQARVHAKTRPEIERNVQALEQVQPKIVPPTDISIKIGSSWVPTDVYEAFGREVLQMPRAIVAHNVDQNVWEVDGESSQAGVAEFGAHYESGGLIYGPRRIFQEVLKLRALKAPRIRDADGRSYADEAGDIKVAEAIKHMQDAFGRWVWTNDKRRERLVDLYNAKFNTTVERQYRTDYITTPGVATWWNWREHQLRGIARIIVSGTTYLNHAVGAGKTSTMIAAAMELRRLGKVRKPLFVVPNHMLAQFSAEWYQLYPRANLMIADEANFHTSRRKQFVAEAGSGDYDAVIMTYDSFGLIPISDEFSAQIIREEISSFVEALQDTDDRFTRKRLEEAIKRMEARLERGARKKRDQVFTFEELGVDMLFIDEAQKYRKLGFATTQSSVKGIDNAGGPTTMDAFIKTRYIESINPGRGMVFASGTPVTNTLSEIYSLQRFMDTPGLVEHGLQHFDAWASTFGAVEEEPERDVAGTLAYVERFTGIPNAPELSRLVRRFMDVVTPEQLHRYVTVPEYRGGQREKVLIEQSPEQEFHHTTIVSRLETARRQKNFKEYLRLINEARLAAIDPRLLKPGELMFSEGAQVGIPVEFDADGHPIWTGEGSKLGQAIDNIFRIWKNTSDHPFYGWDENGQYTDEPEFSGPATQIVFSPLGFTKAFGRLHLPTEIRAQLVIRGVPDEQIAYMGDYDTHTKKKRLFNDMNEGKIRILIGSEKNMGTGVNVQERLAVEHNLAPVWFPADDEQRVGRILRQGNRNREVRVMDYSTVGSYDYAMWQMMARKGKAIERFFRGDPNLRFVGDIGEHAHYGQLMALTAEDPRLLQLVELQNELTKAEREKAASDDRMWNKRAAVQNLDARIAETEQNIEATRKAVARRTDEFKGDKFRITVGSRSYTDRADAAVELTARWNAFVGGATGKGQYHVDLGEFAGFAIEGSFTRYATGFINNPVVQLVMDGAPVLGRSLHQDMDDPGPLLVRSLAQQLGNMEARTRDAEGSVVRLRAEREKLQGDLDSGEAVGPERVNELRAAVGELERAIRAETRPAAAAPPARPEPPTGPEVLHQTRPSRGNPLAEQMVAEHGTDSIDTTGYVLRDGRMAEPPGQTDPVAVMRASDTAWIDPRQRVVRAEGPLSAAQMAAIIEQVPDAPARLIHTVDGREQVNVQTRDPLTVDTLRSAFPAPEPDVLHSEKLGAVWWDQEGKAVIALSREADFDTLMEELAHVFRRQLSGDQEQAVAEWAGAKRDPGTGRWVWGEGAEERFARGFVDWLREGVVPNDAVLTTFERARKWLRDIYAGIRSQFNSDVRRVFEDLVILNDYPEIKAFERVSGEVGDIEAEVHFTDGGRRLRVRREGGAYLVDAHDDKGRQILNRRHGDVADAAREIIGLPTVETPVPAGNRAMRIETPDERAAREREAELRIATDDMALSEVAAGAGIAEDQLLHQTRGEDELAEQRLSNLAQGRKTQLLNRLQELGVEPGDETPWSSKPARDLSYEDLRRVYNQLLQARAEGGADVARRYERREIVRYGRRRLRTIQASLQGILRESKTLPDPLRSALRQLLADLEIGRRGAATVERADPVNVQTDPARLLSLLEKWVDREDIPVGTLFGEEVEKPLADMTLQEVERLHNSIQHVIHQVRALQSGLRAAYREEARRVGDNAARELLRAKPMRSSNVRRALTALAGERPGFLLERIGGGLRSALYSTLYRNVTAGAQEKRRVVMQEGGRYIADQRAAGLTRTSRQLEAWLREAVDVPEWAREFGHTWRRGEVMSLALMWRDPYSRRNLIDPRSAAEQEASPFPGGIVFVDRGQQATTPVVLAPAQIMDLIKLLGPEERRFIGAPVRNLFDRLYRRLNDVFFAKHGFHLEQAPSYFPIEVASAHVPANPEAGGAVDFYRGQEAKGSAEPYQGMIQWRTGAIKPMALRSINTVINRALDRSATYVGLELPLTAARRLMARRRVTALMRERWGADVPNVLDRYLRDVAGSGEIQDGLERWAMQLKRRVSVGSLGLSGKVALSQALSLPVYAIHVPWRYLVDATAQMARPSAARSVLETHTRYDPDFAERSNYGFDPDVQQGRMFTSRGVLPPDRSKLARYYDRASTVLMWGIRRVDRFTVARGEQAAVLHALDTFEGKAAMPTEMHDELGVTAEQARALSVEERLRLAYRWGNWVTGRTQPSFLPEHMSAFARGKITRYFSSFSGYTNVAFNALRRVMRGVRETGLRDAETNRAAMMAIMSIMVIGPLGVSMMGYIRSLARGDEPDPLWKSVLAAQSALVYGWKDVQYWLLTGRRFGRGIDNPTMAAVEDMISSLDALASAIGSGERVRPGEIAQAVGGIPPWEPRAEDRMERAAQRVVASGFRMVGLPYWTPRSWSDIAANVPELLD